MVKITYIAADGLERVVDARLGQTVMEAAVKTSVEGIVAECGGSCACGTCRVYVDQAWTAVTGSAGDMERDMLSFTAEGDSNVRLSCQISITDELDGLIVRMPASQHWE